MAVAISDIVTVGDQVLLSKDLVGEVRFIGEIQGKTGIWYGISLTQAKGKNDGKSGNVQYFDCKPQRGIFVKKHKIVSINSYVSSLITMLYIDSSYHHYLYMFF